MRQRLSHKVRIQLLYIRIFVGKTKWCILVQEVEALSSFVGKFFAIVDDLSASAYTAARACHDFHEIIMDFSAFDLLQQTSCISKSAYNSSFHNGIANLDFS